MQKSSGLKFLFLALSKGVESASIVNSESTPVDPPAWFTDPQDLVQRGQMENFIRTIILTPEEVQANERFVDELKNERTRDYYLQVINSRDMSGIFDKRELLDFLGFAMDDELSSFLYHAAGSQFYEEGPKYVHYVMDPTSGKAVGLKISRTRGSVPGVDRGVLTLTAAIFPERVNDFVDYLMDGGGFSNAQDRYQMPRTLQLKKWDLTV